MKVVSAGFSIFLLFISMTVHAVDYEIFLDTDEQSVGQCQETLDDGVTRSAVAGIDQHVIVHVNEVAQMVESVTVAQCLGDTFANPVVVSEGRWPVGANLGILGSDVIEFTIPFSALGSPTSINITATSRADNGAQGGKVDDILIQPVFTPSNTPPGSTPPANQATFSINLQASIPSDGNSTPATPIPHGFLIKKFLTI